MPKLCEENDPTYAKDATRIDGMMNSISSLRRMSINDDPIKMIGVKIMKLVTLR